MKGERAEKEGWRAARAEAPGSSKKDKMLSAVEQVTGVSIDTAKLIHEANERARIAEERLVIAEKKIEAMERAAMRCVRCGKKAGGAYHPRHCDACWNSRPPVGVAAAAGAMPAIPPRIAGPPVTTTEAPRKADRFELIEVD